MSDDKKAKDEEIKLNATKQIKIDSDANVLEFSAAVELARTDVVASSGSENSHHSKGHSSVGESTQTNITDLSKFIEKSSRADMLESQVKLITLFVTEAKILESEMNQLIKVLYSKHPDAKPYLLKMKKLLQDHANIQKALEDARKAS